MAELQAVAAGARLAAGVGGARGAGRMRAWRLHSYGAPAELRLEDARAPALREPRDVLVRVSYASLNPIDVAMIGGYGARALNTLRALEGAEGVEFPLVPGRDFVGVVERAGPAARLRRGERVWGVVPPHRQGSHAEFVVVRDEWAGPAPRALDAASAGGALYAALTAAAAPPCSTATPPTTSTGWRRPPLTTWCWTARGWVARRPRTSAFSSRVT